MTYLLGTGSRTRLAGVHPKLVKVVERAIALTTQDFVVQEGLRSAATQAEYLRRGVTKTLKSKHLKQPDGFGHAVDLVPFVGGMPRWEWPVIFPIVVAMRAAALELDAKLTWGGIWDRNIGQLADNVPGIIKGLDQYKVRHAGSDFLDGPHYQMED